MASTHLTGRVVRSCLSAAIVAVIGVAEFRVGKFNHTTVALTLLLAVLAIATRWGLPESLSAAAAGMLCFNYFFLPPVGALTIADPENWVALITFVVTAVGGQPVVGECQAAGGGASPRGGSRSRAEAHGRAKR